jgi:hypothetical protein
VVDALVSEDWLTKVPNAALNKHAIGSLLALVA